MANSSVEESLRYVEIAVGAVSNRNRIITIDDLPKDLKGKEAYRSLFIFDKGIKDHVERAGTVTGYSGVHSSDALIFDFDGDDLSEVKKDALEFCRHLEVGYDLPIKYLRIYFSGAKGFHIEIPIEAFGKMEPSIKFYEVYRNIAKEMIGEIKSADLSIYEIRRLMRIPNTLNLKSNLYKIQLSFSELRDLDIDRIKELAQKQREIDVLPQGEISKIASLGEMYDKWKNNRADLIPQASQGPLTIQSSIKDLLVGVERGNRNNSAIRIAGHFVNRREPMEVAVELMRMWNEKNSPPMDDTELQRVVSTAYRRYAVANGNRSIYTMKNAEEVYRKYVSNESVRVRTGFKGIDAKLRGMMPGETCCILGKTAVGKSAFLQNIGMNYSTASGEPILFFSMEMPIESVFERSIQLGLGEPGIVIESAFRSGNGTIVQQANQFIQENPHLYTVTQSGLTLDDIEEIIRTAEEEVYQKKTGLVMIDYLGLVRGTGKDIYEQVSSVARGMKDLAKKMNVPIIFLSQMNRKYSQYDMVEIGAARDSGAVDEASDFVLGLWMREKEETADTKLLCCSIVKNRRGGLSDVPIDMDKKSLRMREVQVSAVQNELRRAS